MHALQVAEDLAAQIEHHLLAGPLHEVGLQELEDEAQEEQSEEDGRDLRDAVQRLRAEPTPEPGWWSGNWGQITIDGDFNQIRTEHIGERLEDDGNDGDRDLPSVGAQVAEQPGHEPGGVCFTSYFFF